MKIKLSLIAAMTITSLNAEIVNKYVFTNPLPNAFKAIDNGGTKAAIDAYKDGVGAVVLDNIGVGIQIDNSAMNTLVYKYGEAAKASGSTIVDEVMYGSGSTNTKDKVLVGNLTVDGASCNDQNAATQGETWLNGNCQGGISTNGTPCNDGDHKTITDIYTNGVCAGTNVEGQSCSDDNFLTIQDKYIDGVCTGTLTANGQACNDDNIMTVNDKYTNGVCAGTLTVNGQTCNDGHVMTVNDIYTNGVCAGTLTVNGQSCNDDNVMTVNDIYTNGVCAGTLTVNGTTCSDGNVATYADKWLNGVCTGYTNGTTCNDNVATTYGDIYTNGICAGYTNGTTCSDGNAATYADKYTNGVCSGVANGTTCNDNVVTTYGDIYTNGTCAGYTNGTTCNDNNSATYLDKYTNGICSGILNGTSCNDNNAATINDIYTNGVCAGTSQEISGFTRPPGIWASYTVNGYYNISGYGSSEALFNNNSSDYAYWSSPTDYLDITVTSSFRIWAYTDIYPSYDSSLIFTNKTTGIVVTNSVNGPTRTSGSWKLSSSTIPAGSYRIKVKNYSTYCGSNTAAQCGYPLEQRVDHEWFIEKQ